MAKRKTTEEYQRRWLEPNYFDNIVRNGFMKNNHLPFWDVLSNLGNANGEDYRAYLEALSKYLEVKQPSRKREFMRMIFNSSIKENEDIAEKINNRKQEGLILDLGCGICSVYSFLSSENKRRYYGVEIAADILKDFSNVPNVSSPERVMQMDLLDKEAIINKFGGKCSSVVDCHASSKIKVSLDDLAAALILADGEYYKG